MVNLRGWVPYWFVVPNSSWPWLRARTGRSTQAPGPQVWWTIGGVPEKNIRNQPFVVVFVVIYPTPSWMDGLGVGGTGFREGGRFIYPDSDIERCLMAGRDPRELNRRTATSFSMCA